MVTGAEDSSLPRARGGGEHVDTAYRPPRNRLFVKYAFLFIGLVGTALLINSSFDLWFSFQENKAALIRVQQEKAESAAQRIAEFVEEIKSQIGWTTHAQWDGAPINQRYQDYTRLQRQVPAITELAQLDPAGKEQLKVSRVAMSEVGSGTDFSQSLAFTEAKAHRTWFSPVYLRKESEPYMTLAMARDGRNAGVTVAEINLKLLFDVITALKIGRGGYVYVVDGRGRLIAHPDISLVLRDTDLSKLPQVAAALNPQPGQPAVTTAENLASRAVLTAHSTIPQLGWRVFVEVPLNEAFAPLYSAALRTLVLLVFGLIAATLVALLIARRMTGPIRALQQGAAQIGAGDLGRRIDIRTGDELEGLAQQFNHMAADLQKSYAELEQRVADRTAELSEALEQQTATAEVLGVINSSPGDLAPVFDAMLRKATSLCDAPFAGLQTFDDGMFNFVAHLGFPEAFVAARRGPQHPGPNTALGRIAAGELLIHIPDVAADDVYRAGDPTRRSFADLTGARTAIWVSLRKDDRLLGVFAIYRTEVRPFTEKQIALLSNFAAQAVIAMENARLLSELRQRTEEVAELNRGLEARVAEQVDELGRVGRLKRFLAPQLAELIVSQGDEKILESHRREIVVVFCDLRGYTAFTETAEPEEVLEFLREYHGALGPLVAQFEGTLDQFSGDGIMVFFNDPVPIPDPTGRAVRMAVAMREAAAALISNWRRLGRDLGFGVGVAQGYATLGQIGFSERSGYTAIGTVCNVAARLCAEAKDGQILISQRVAARLDDNIALEDIGALTLKGLTQPVMAYNVPLAAGNPALRVIEGGPQSV